MLRIFFCASAAGGATSPTTPSTETSTTNTNKQSLIGRAMDFSSFAERTRGARDGRPGDTREEFEGHRAERDSSTVTSVESVQDGSEKAGRADHATRPCLKNGRHDLGAERTASLHELVRLTIPEDDVEGDLVDSRVLAPDGLRQLDQRPRRHRPTTSSFTLVSSSGSASGRTWFTVHS